MATYEVTVSFSDRSYDESRRFLTAVAASPGRLAGFRRSGESGVALTFVIEGHLDRQTAVLLARQQAAGIWPNFKPATTAVEDLSAR